MYLQFNIYYTCGNNLNNTLCTFMYSKQTENKKRNILGQNINNDTAKVILWSDARQHRFGYQRFFEMKSWQPVNLAKRPECGSDSYF